MAGKMALVTGLHPSVVEFSKFPGLTAEKMMAALEADTASVKAAGYDVEFYYIDFKTPPEEALRKALTARKFDVVVIGAGVRTDPDRFILFEKLVNVAHECAPSAKICFNTKPGDTAEAIRRWI